MSLLDKPALALKLERVLGLSSQSPSTFCSAPSGDLFYAAGCFVVKYNPEENKQKGFYKLSKAVSSVAITEDGQFLAVGERGQTPTTTIWSVDKFEKLATLTGHKHGVGCMAFAPGGRYLVTVGFKLDRQLIVWDWKSGAKLSTQRLGNKVHSISFHNSGDYFVTAGDRHLKWWTIVEVLEGESISIEGKAASIVEAQRNSVFMDAICGVDSTDTAVYCTTSTGMLCMFGEHKTMDKWVQLESSSSFSLELFPGDGTPGILAVGCANGIIRCFDPRNLAYIATVPLPAPLLGALPRQNSESVPGKEPAYRNSLYAACYAVRKVPGTRASPVPKLAAIYADRSLFVWDISDIYSIAKYRSFMFHRACIWDIQFIESAGQSTNEDNSPAPQTPLPKGSFVTCSADNTVRFWNVDPRMQRLSKYRSIHSREMLHGIDLLAGLNLEDMPHEDQNTSMATNASQVGTGLNTSSLSATHYLAQQTASVADLDICAGIPDTELPDRPQSQYAPRAMAVHPYAHEIACGDKMGTLKVFDIRTMQEVCSTPAHQAEILTLSYSPAMTHNRENNLWSLKGSSESGDDDNQEEVVLLASAGRDRLIHIFNASEQYEPIQTMDHHTSSVTITKFTSDGRRFLSCGGDRTIVFSAVDGPVVQRIKSVQTPHGTINGLAVEASNKFAVTSGQDKRLNIWNLQSGKHMRAYKNENIHSELYKSDIDPSGMYIATCGFDKSISIFDFFSGELITQVSGHSELVTGVKFSPDGRYLVSIGGDGCILMWRIADFLVKAMQDRLVELMSSAQRRNLKATAAVHKSHTEGTNSGSNAADLPPPLPTPSFGVPTPPTPPQQALKVPPPVSAVVAQDSKTAPPASVPKNRWAARVEQDHGYELFGKKVDPTVTPERNRNKFTLELSATAAAGLAVATGSGIKDQQHSESDNLGSTSNRLADELEAADDVILMVDSDEDEGDGSHLFKAPALSTTDPSSTAESYESDFEDPTNESAGVLSPGGTEPDLDQTQHAIEGMEKSAQDLENWLENMIRGDGKLDESVAPATATPAHSKATDEPSQLPEPKVHQRRVVNKTTGEVSVRPTVARPAGGDGDPLDRSLSSAFFQHLRRSGDSHLAREDRGDNLLPPPPPNNTEVDAASVEIQTKERKQRETAAAVAQMRERLRVMGILQKTQQGGVEPATPSSSDLSPLPEESASAMQSPVPSKGPSSLSKDDDGYDTASTTSEPDEVRDGNEETGVLIRNSQDKASQIVEKINQKSSKYKHILKELEQAKQRAAESYQELLDLRQSLDQSMRQSSAVPSAAAHHKRTTARTANAAGHDDSLNVSMAQVDQLMSQFRSSLTGLSGISGGTASAGTSRKSGFPASTTSGTELGFSGSTESRLDLDTVNSLELNSFLERYSDRLVDLVGEKLVKKINNK